MSNLSQQKWSKFAIIIFILTLLTLLFIFYGFIFNLIQPITEGGEKVMRGVIFTGLISFVLFFLLLVLNIVGLVLCIKNKRRGKVFSIIGIIFSVILNLYLITAALSGPK